MSSIQARIEPKVAASLRTSAILVVGLGSVGSFVAEHLARSGVGKLICVDHDRVELSNLSRSSYRIDQVGQYKATAIGEIVHQINPITQVQVFPSKFRDVGKETLRQIFGEADLVIGATDDPETQILINRCAFFLKRPALFIALYRGAKGGEVAVAIPTITPCFECQVKPHMRLAREHDVVADTDYGTGRLQGEIALGCDIHHVCTAALKLAVSLLVSSDPVPLGSFTADVLAKGFHYLTMSMEPDYWFYPRVFSGVPNQYAYQSVWLSARHDEACEVCGQSEQEDPFEAITPSLARTSLDHLIS